MSGIFFYFNFFLCVYVWMFCLFTMCLSGFWRTENNVRSSGTTVTDGCNCHMDAKNRTWRVLWKSSQVILTSEPSLQPSLNSLANVYKASFQWSEIPMRLFTDLLPFLTDLLTAPLSVSDLLHLPSFPVLKKLLQDQSRNNCPHI